MNAALPDVSLTDLAPSLSPLAWVGMQQIDLPITLDELGYRRTLHARADVQVDLPTPQVKGIHMSRLYRLLDRLGHDEALSPAGLVALLRAMINSHSDCDSRNARLRLRVKLLTRRQALVTEGLSGWKAYPVSIDAALIDGRPSLRAHVTVPYSSTCPCSAALSRQLVEQAFLKDFKAKAAIESAEVVTWLQLHATLATPHSQRSEAEVSIDIATDAADFGLLALIDRIEAAVATPVQTAVKRADEQAFAAMNGTNLMFVEDAARRIQAALAGFGGADVYVRHMESLHPHDAVAWSVPARSGGGHP